MPILQLDNIPTNANFDWVGRMEDRPHAITFLSSANITMVGLSLLGSFFTPLYHTGEIQLLDTDTNTVVVSHTFTYYSYGDTGYYDTMWDTPGYILADTNYTVSVMYHTWTQMLYLGTGGVTTATVSCDTTNVTLQFSESDTSLYYSDVTQGVIPRLIIAC